MRRSDKPFDRRRPPVRPACVAVEVSCGCTWYADSMPIGGDGTMIEFRRVGGRSGARLWRRSLRSAEERYARAEPSVGRRGDSGGNDGRDDPARRASRVTGRVVWISSSSSGSTRLTDRRLNRRGHTTGGNVQSGAAGRDNQRQTGHPSDDQPSNDQNPLGLR